MSRDVYEKYYCNGDRISDAKIVQAIEDFTAAHTALLKLGPCFEVSRKEIGRCLMWLEDIKHARDRK